jgi:hypothetical protein
VSKESQQKFLNSFDELLKKRAGIYRAAQANKVSHVFVISKRAIQKGIEDTIKRKFKSDSTERIVKILAALDNDINQLVNNIVKKLDFQVMGSKGDKVLVRIRKLRASPYQARYIFVSSKKDESSLSNIYGKIYNSYIKELNSLAEIVGKTTRDIAGKNLGNNAKKYWNLEHDKGKGAVESQVSDALNLSLAASTDMPRAEVLQWLEAQGVDLTIIRNTKTKSMEVHIGSKYGNMEEGIISRDKKAKLRRIVSSTLSSQVGRIIDLPGSDSFRTINKKEVIVKTVVLTDNTDIIGKIISVTTKTAKNAVKSGKKGRVRGKTGARTSKGVASNPLALVALINKTLPKVIQSNMGPPRLENRTGQFAASAEVLTADKTAKGFLSFAYTYQKFPYQTFEPGYAQGSVDRDPRKLIDQSIREIAVQFAIGRFYTRRV